MTARLALLAALVACSAASAGTIYKIHAKSGDKDVTYEVRFGGGRINDHMTAFDPKSKKFVYLRWPRKGAAPVPAGEIFDHRTGETVKLYKFPGVESPLPAIPSVADMKVCPVTGDKAFKAERHIIID